RQITDKPRRRDERRGSSPRGGSGAFVFGSLPYTPVKTAKTGQVVSIPVLPELQSEIERHPKTNMTFLMTTPMPKPKSQPKKKAKKVPAKASSRSAAKRRTPRWVEKRHEPSTYNAWRYIKRANLVPDDGNTLP